MQKLTNGQGQIPTDGQTIRQVIDYLDSHYPGFKARICNEHDQIRSEIAVAVDGEVRVSKALLFPNESSFLLYEVRCIDHLI